MTKNRIIILLMTANVLLLTTLGVREVYQGAELDLAGTAHATGTVSKGTVPAPGTAAAATNAPAVPVRPGSSQDRRTEITEAARTVSPAIVSVGASQTGYVVHPYAGFFSEYIPAFPFEEKIPYLGSGVIIDPDGLVVTNHHVVEKQQDVFVTLTDGREFPGKVLAADELLDVALIQLEGASGLPTVRLGDSDDILVGEWVIAMGNPFGNVIGDPIPTVTVGVVSALKRSFRPNSSNLGRAYLDMIQTDAAINPGNSGGALINAQGELVGINTFIVSRSGGAEGIGFAIPVNRVKTVVQEILMHGRIRTRLVDFQVQNLTARIAKLVGSKAEKGAVVSEMLRSGPGDRCGLRVGDVITSIDGKPVKDAEDLKLSIWTRPVGTRFQLEVDREGEPLQFEYELTEAAKRP